jgi:hypothetical protein
MCFNEKCELLSHGWSVESLQGGDKGKREWTWKGSNPRKVYEHNCHVNSEGVVLIFFF